MTNTRRDYEEAFLSGQMTRQQHERARQQNFDPTITVHEFTLESVGRKITELEKLNAELLAALRELRDDDSIPGRFLPFIAAAIAKAEGKP